MKILPHKQKFK